MREYRLEEAANEELVQVGAAAAVKGAEEGGLGYSKVRRVRAGRRGEGGRDEEGRGPGGNQRRERETGHLLFPLKTMERVYISRWR